MIKIKSKMKGAEKLPNVHEALGSTPKYWKEIELKLGLQVELRCPGGQAEVGKAYAGDTVAAT